MIYDPENAPHLKPWLVRTLEPICDAEPGALADYILALLKHNVPENEMRKELSSQLDEFLEKECPAFIDTLFTALRTKSYLPYTSGSDSMPAKSLDTGIPIPLDGLLSPSIPTSPSRKRSLEDVDRDDRAPAKGQRLNSDGQFSRYGKGRGAGPDYRSTGGWNNRGRGQDNFYGVPQGMNGNVSSNRPTSYQPPDQRRVCRDYYNLGYCSRGALCKYSHGEDALIPDQLYSNMNVNGPGMPGPGMPFLPMFGNGIGMGGVGAAYDPRDSQMDMRTNGRSQMRPAVISRLQQEDSTRPVPNMRASGELPVIQDLTPQVAHSDVQPNPIPHPSSSNPEIPQEIPLPPVLPPQDVEMTPVDAPPRPSSGWRGRGGGRGRGGFGDAGTFRPERRKDKTLVLEKIPEDKLSLSHVNDWFKRFGTVTNVAIDQAHHKALISFSTHEEAHAAWKSEDAVFGNRFVKVFWHRPLEGQGQVGQRALVASAPLVTNANAPPKPTPTPPSSSTVPRTTKAIPTLAAKQQLLEQQIAEQKSLMASLATASSEEKKTIMARIRKLDEEMKASSSTSSAAGTAGTDQEQQERERLDKELDLHGVGASAGGPEGEKVETTEELKAKLEKLKAEAASLGITDTSMDTSEGSYGGSYRPYRGRARGRGRGFFRGAPRGGAAPRASMKLDNRPKSLLVKGVSTENEQALRDWYETTGQLASVSTSDDGYIVSFKTRHGAEQGLLKGSSIPIIGSVQISWHAGAVPPASSTTPGPKPSIGDAKPESEVNATTSAGPRHSPEPESSTHNHVHEEEVVASGWGDDDEDGMGM